MSLALSTYVLFILLTQSRNGAQFLNFIFLLVLFAAAPAAEVYSIDIIPLTSVYASL